MITRRGKPTRGIASNIYCRRSPRTPRCRPSVSFVLDSSMARKWALPDENSAVVDGVFERLLLDGAFVPSRSCLEVANALLTAERRGRIHATTRTAVRADLRLLPIEIDPETESRAWTSILAMAEECRFTTYDAAYLELAERRKIPLATLDQVLTAAARVRNVLVLG